MKRMLMTVLLLVMTLGLGRDGLRRIEVDDQFRLVPRALDAAIAAEKDPSIKTAFVEARAAVVQQALDMLRPGGKAYFGIYEGDKGGVGRATLARLQRDGANVVPLTRKEVDLLAPNAAEQLAAQLTGQPTLVLTSALAPVKTAAMLLDNLRMMQAVLAAVKVQPEVALLKADGINDAWNRRVVVEIRH